MGLLYRNDVSCLPDDMGECCACVFELLILLQLMIGDDRPVACCEGCYASTTMAAEPRNLWSSRLITIWGTGQPP